MKVKVATNFFDCCATDEIVCPFCGGVQSDSWEYGKGEDIGDVGCVHCGRTFYASRIIEVKYSSNPPGCNNDWRIGDQFEDGITDKDDEDWANTHGAKSCEIKEATDDRT